MFVFGHTLIHPGIRRVQHSNRKDSIFDLNPALRRGKEQLCICMARWVFYVQRHSSNYWCRAVGEKASRSVWHFVYVQLEIKNGKTGTLEKVETLTTAPAAAESSFCAGCRTITKVVSLRTSNT